MILACLVVIGYFDVKRIETSSHVAKSVSENITEQIEQDALGSSYKNKKLIIENYVGSSVRQKKIC